MARKNKPLFSNNFNNITLKVDVGELVKVALFALVLYKIIDIFVVILS